MSSEMSVSKSRLYNKYNLRAEDYWKDKEKEECKC